MSDGGTGEKTEEPTPQKLRQAREKGQISKSQDAIQAFLFIGVFSVLALTIGSLGDSLMIFLLDCIDAGVRKPNITTVLTVANEGLWQTLVVCLPALVTAFVLGLFANYVQVGFLFTAHPLKPDIKKLNPVSGFKQLFGKKKLVESLKQIVKFTMVSIVVWKAAEEAMPDIVRSQRLGLHQGLQVAGGLIFDISVRAGSLFLVVAMADFFWQRHVFKKDMMMSKYDVKQEFKQSEGDPEQKAQRKALGEEMILHGAQQNVAKADAVITNPAHIAVAIKYDSEKGTAPTIVAKGMRKNADKIKEIARAEGVPILRNVPLAQALNKLDLEEEVPEDLYDAVAEVLNFVYELKSEGKI